MPELRPRMNVPQIFDRKAYALQRARATGGFLSADVGDALAYRLQTINRRFRHGLELSVRDDISRTLEPLADRWTRAGPTLSRSLAVVADDELLPFADGQFDVIVSALALHAVND